MAYNWTKKRKAARNRLVRLFILLLFLIPTQSIYGPVVEPSMHSLSYNVVVGILFLIGIASIAQDVMILIDDEE